MSIKFNGALQLLFVGLKLTGHIAWSWFWVMAPLEFELALVGLFLISYFSMSPMERILWKLKPHDK